MTSLQDSSDIEAKIAKELKHTLKLVPDTPAHIENEELREAVKRFCRTDQAADNLVAYIISRQRAYATQALSQLEGKAEELDSKNFEFFLHQTGHDYIKVIRLSEISKLKEGLE